MTKHINTVGQVFTCSTYLGNDGTEHFTIDRPYHPEQWEVRSKYEYPYSYSPFIIYGHEIKNTNINDHGTVYSDRMFQWDYKKTNRWLKKIFGNENQYFNNKDPALVEKFLQKRFNYPRLRLDMIVEWCNLSNGYPLWSFHYTIKGHPPHPRKKKKS